MAIKRKDGENLSKENIAKVISLLEAAKPITKKEACEILNISYNTKRLGNIITEYKEHEEYSAKRRKELRNKKVEKGEMDAIITSYLSGESLSEISDRTFRSVNVIKNVLARYNVPIRSLSATYQNPIMFDDNTWKDEYSPGDLVYSARYNRPCTIVKLAQVHPQHGNCYSIEFHGENRFFAYQPAYELADLTQLQTEFNVTLTDLDTNEVRTLLYEAYLKSKKMDNKK